MDYLNCHIESLQSKGGLLTAKEISGQPDLWKSTYLKLLREKEKILKFLEKFQQENNPFVILTGAGTSAFIGEVLEGPMQRKWSVPCRAIATTDIVTHPENYFISTRATLLISFARSGDSPESLHTVRLAKKYCDRLYDLNITCNAEGSLAMNTQSKSSCLFLLPKDSNDQSLVMTGSFSSMLLAGLLIMNIKEISQMESIMFKLCKMGKHVLDKYSPGLRKIAEMDFERMLVLGSGPLFGIARESHMKVQEMANGRVVCKFDSFLGVRHGPRVVINDSTVILYMISGNAYARQYELDFIQSVNVAAWEDKSIAIGNGYDDSKFRFGLGIKFPDGTEDIPEEFLALPYALPAQIIGFYKSLHLGLCPDSPSTNNVISRVVQGVKIYHK